MEQFIRAENLKLYRRLLAETDDEERRRVLLALIACIAEQDKADARAIGNPTATS